MVKLVQEYVTWSAKRFPQKDALVMNGKPISYTRLDEKSTQLANFIKDRGVKRGDRVCFYLPKSINSFISILAILKADAIYVPINISTPQARFKDIVALSRSDFVIVNERKSLLPDISATYINLNTEKDIFIKERNKPVSYENDGSDTAYILYTSGSTGVPKGVMISHDNIINATDWAVDEFGINENDRMSQHPPLSFDLSTFDIYCAFKAGATLFLVPEELSLFPGAIIKFIEDNELTIWNSVPSVMVYLYNAGLVKLERTPELKKVFFNGEAFPTKFLIEWMKTYPEKIFVNMYGPTEATVQCTFYVIPGPPKDPTRLVPIGKACRNVEVFIVKENGTRGGVGETGELYVAGRGVGQGYWKDPKRTKESFVPHPFESEKGTVYKTGDLAVLDKNGNYNFVGRKDFQVKVMGNRIELGDIESALYSLSYVAEAGVIAVSSEKTEGNELIAYVSLKEKRKEALIKEDLLKLLPSYMIPRKIIIKKSLPKTSSDKIDRIKLKEIYGWQSR